MYEKVRDGARKRKRDARWKPSRNLATEIDQHLEGWATGRLGGFLSTQHLPQFPR